MMGNAGEVGGKEDGAFCSRRAEALSQSASCMSAFARLTWSKININFSSSRKIKAILYNLRINGSRAFFPWGSTTVITLGASGLLARYQGSSFTRGSNEELLLYNVEAPRATAESSLREGEWLPGLSFGNIGAIYILASL
jgi:hypothetical protein